MHFLQSGNFMNKVTFLASHREYRTVIGSATGNQPILPVIVTDQGVLDQLVHYMYLNRRKSRSWQDGTTLAVQLLVDYMAANQGLFNKPRNLFIAFSNELHAGTIGHGKDPSGLWWHPRNSKSANKLIGYITRFSDWLSLRNQDAEFQLNPWREATRHEQRLNWAAFVHRKDNAFLSHLFGKNEDVNKSRVVRSQSLPCNDVSPPKTFPESKIDLLLTKGFHRRVRDQRGLTDLRNVLITMLMHYGGLRISEALSLWSDDVSIEGGEVIVRVNHPEYGLAPDNKSNRADYLQSKFGLVPRKNLVKSIDPLFLGWKDPLITDVTHMCFEVYFFPSDAGHEFVRLWRDYHLIQRIKPAPGYGHPYAFTNQFGQPYSYRMFRKAHERAIERIGLDYCKLLGTTPHGHRHAYGQRLAAANLPEIYIKNAMHHKSIESSKTYTQPTSNDFRRRMNDIETRLSEQHADATTQQVGKE